MQHMSQLVKQRNGYQVTNTYRTLSGVLLIEVSTELFVRLILSVRLIWGQVTYHQSKVPSKSEKQWQWLLFAISAFFATADKQSCPHTPSNLKIKYKISTLQVATILVTMAPKILELAT